MTHGREKQAALYGETRWYYDRKRRTRDVTSPAARRPRPVVGQMPGPRWPDCEKSGPMPNDDCVNNADVTGVSNSALRSSTPARSEFELAPNASSTQDS